MQRQDFVPLLTLKKNNRKRWQFSKPLSVGFFTLKIDKNVINFKLEYPWSLGYNLTATFKIQRIILIHDFIFVKITSALHN